MMNHTCPAEGGPHLPTPEGWKAELAWELCATTKHKTAVCITTIGHSQTTISPDTLQTNVMIISIRVILNTNNILS